MNRKTFLRDLQQASSLLSEAGSILSQLSYYGYVKNKRLAKELRNIQLNAAGGAAGLARIELLTKK